MGNNNETIQITIDGMPLDILNVLNVERERAYCLINKFKELLGLEGLRNLFEEESRKTEEFFLDVLNRSTPGKYKLIITELYAKNCNTKDFFAVFPRGGLKHPEHLIANMLPEGKNEILEAVVDRYIRFKMNPKPNMDVFPTHEVQPDATAVMRFECLSMDGVPLGIYTCHELTDVGDDMKFKGCLIVPDAMEDELIKKGQLHLAVEYYNLLSAAQKNRLMNANK